MKKILLAITALLLSFLFLPNTSIVRAEESNTSLEVNTLYPENILDYHNLTDIEESTMNDNYIAYTLNSQLIIFNKNNKQSIYIDDYRNIVEIKFINHNQLLVVNYSASDGGNIYNIKLTENFYTTQIISEINIANLHLIDIFENNNVVYIGFITLTESTNRYYLYTIDNTISLATPIEHHNNTHDNYQTSIGLTINQNSQYVVYSESGSNSLNLFISPHEASLTNATSVAMTYGTKKLKYYKTDNQSFLLAFTSENVYTYLISNNELSILEKHFSIEDIEVLAFTDVDIYGEQILISDRDSKLIKTLKLNFSDTSTTITDDTTLLASSTSELGRFNNISNIHLQGNTIYIADTFNNRIQIVENNKCYQISDLSTNSKPSNIVIDSKQNIYFCVENQTEGTSSIVQYSQKNHIYTHSKTYSQYGTNTTFKPVTMTIDSNDNIYVLDYSNNTYNLLCLSDAGLQFKKELTSLSADDNTKLDYIKGKNLLIIYNNNALHLLDLNGEVVDSLIVGNFQDFTTDFSNIYTLSNNTLQLITINNNTMQFDEKSLYSDKFTHLNCLDFDVENNRIFAFNQDTQSIVYFDCNLAIPAFNFENIENANALPSTQSPQGVNIINNGIIYSSPYFIGTTYNNISKCIAIDTYDDFYRVLFKHDNTLTSGFLHKNYVSIEQHNTSRKIKVLTTNITVPVFKYPTLLKSSNQAVITSYLPINYHLTITYNPFPISIDDQTFYLCVKDGQIGYVFNADIVLDDTTNISYLNTENATISAIGQETINILDENKQVIKQLQNQDRIYVDNYDKNSEYTKIIYKDADLNTIEGYILTEYVQMDELDDNKIVLIIIIVFSVIMLGVIITSYIIIKKKDAPSA